MITEGERSLLANIRKHDWDFNPDIWLKCKVGGYNPQDQIDFLLEKGLAKKNKKGNIYLTPQGWDVTEKLIAGDKSVRVIANRKMRR